MATKDIFEGVLACDVVGTPDKVKAELDAGTNAEAILKAGLIAAMDELGGRFSNGDVFIPEMIRAAKEMQAGVEDLKPFLTQWSVSVCRNSGHRYGQRGIIPIEGRLADAETKDLTLEGRIVTDGKTGEWRKLPVTFNGGRFSATIESLAGGWHRLEMRALSGDSVLAEAAVDHVGVGEVFVVAGQSNAANYGQERQSTKSGQVVTFDGEHWQFSNDPQPGASGTGGQLPAAVWRCHGAALWGSRANTWQGGLRVAVGGDDVRYPCPPTRCINDASVVDGRRRKWKPHSK